MDAPICRYEPAFFRTSHYSVASPTLFGVLPVLLLALGLGACHSGGGKVTGVRDASPANADLPNADLAAPDGARQTPAAQDGRLPDASADGLGRQGEDGRYAEETAPADTGTDSGTDSGTDDSIDSAPPGARDGGSDRVDGRDGPSDAMDALDAPAINPDSASDVGPNRPDAALPGPEAPDNSLSLDGNTALDTQDAKGADTDDLDGGGPCCGCLCRDPSWSCSRDTCVDSTGHALTLAAEAGFFELAGGSYVSESQTRPSPIHRIWYSFQPASTAPESKPLAVFFNGGPGSATSAYLFSLNTAPYTLDPAFTGTAKIANNPNSWAQFANLLYIDGPGTGFSYPLALADGSKPSVGIDLDRDAGSFLRVVVRFLARHPRLQASPVIIVGESYGGTRATLMLDHILTYQTLAGASAAYRDTDLYNDLIAHFAAVWPQENPKTIPAAQLATQFGWQVLIQPVVAGDAQWSRQTPDSSVCLSSGYDREQCNQASGWVDQLVTTVCQNLASIATLHQALGVNPTSIDWLYASARTKAYGRSGGTIISTPEMTKTFGALTSDDNYLLALNTAVTSSYGGTGRTWIDSAIGGNFLADLVHVNTFITNAKYDMVVWTPAIAPGLASFTGTVSSAVIDSAPRTGITRPGWIKVTYAPDVIPAPTTREIRLPTYGNAGHTVSIRDPANLLADVMQWYANSPGTARSANAGLAADDVPVAPISSRKLSGPAPSMQMPYLGP